MCFKHSMSAQLVMVFFCVAGPSIHPHLGAILPPLLTLASAPERGSPGAEAARDTLAQVSAAVAEDGAYLLIAQARLLPLGNHLACPVPAAHLMHLPIASWLDSMIAL